MKIKKSILFLFFSVFISFLNCNRIKMVVKVPVADLRSEPEFPEYKKNGINVNYPLLCPYVWDVGDKLQDTQLLLNDKLFFIDFVNEKNTWNNICDNDWIKVEVTEQKEFKDKLWSNLTGYVQFKDVCIVDKFLSNNLVTKKHLVPVYSLPFDDQSVEFSVSIGTKFRCKHVVSNEWLCVDYPIFGLCYIKRQDLNIILDEHIYGLDLVTRKNICLSAESFLDSPYSWGGRSSFDVNNKKQQTGVDCSALVNLTYRANGFEVPRNAHDQFEFSEKIVSGKYLQPGDLIFFESEKIKGRMSHVLMYLGKGEKGKKFVIEVTGFDPFKTRKISVLDLLGKELNNIKAGEKLKGQVVYFGSFLNDLKKVLEMRTLFKVGLDDSDLRKEKINEEINKKEKNNIGGEKK
ncbi:MAG: NlpC/P60 family protein [bacterium]